MAQYLGTVLLIHDFGLLAVTAFLELVYIHRTTIQPSGP